MSAEPTLAEVLGILQPGEVQELIVDRMGPADDYVAECGRVGQTVKDTFDFIAGCIHQATGRYLGHGAVWIRFVQPDRGAGLIVALSAPSPQGEEVDIVLAANPGVISRPVLAAACQWAFNVVGVRRIVARIPAGADWLAGFARRGGFAFEGVAKDYFDVGADAQVWAMTRHSCRWLPRPSLAITTIDISPPSSNARH